MKTLPLLVVGSALAAAAPAKAPFDGEWVADLDTQTGLVSDHYLVAEGRYRCDSCSPPRAYRADGRPHPVPGDDQVTWESVRIAGPRTMVTHIESPTLSRTTTMTVSPDGLTATYTSNDRRPGVKGPLRTVYIARRTAPAPAGAHAVSGAWQGVRYVTVPEQQRTIMLRVEGDRFVYRHALGYSFTAHFGGGFVPVGGPYKIPVFAAVRRLDARTIEETRKSNGRTTMVRTYTLSPDGRSLDVAVTDPATGHTFRATSRHSP
ncbi:MAG TPA: hypothetical protein VGC56_16410 [Allosphingosinicella sp.]